MNTQRSQQFFKRLFASIAVGVVILFEAGCASPPRMICPTDHTKDKPSLCEIHNQQMRKVEVPIYYGTPPFWTEKWKSEQQALATLFPHAHEYAEGGCVHSFDSPKNVTVFVCDGCRKAEKEWEAAHVKVNEPMTPPFVYLGGQFRKPGMYAWTNGMALQDAFAAAGGFTELAQSRVTLTRADGSTKSYKWKSNSLPVDNPKLNAGDRVFCPNHEN